MTYGQALIGFLKMMADSLRFIVQVFDVGNGSRNLYFHFDNDGLSRLGSIHTGPSLA